jgi:poly(3-hydroxybutyrate) depolymerase
MNRCAALMVAWIACLVTVLPAAAKSKDKVERASFTFGNQSREYSFQIPANAAPTHALPAVVLLHAQGGWASDVMGLWHDFAGRTGFIVIAPESLSNTMWNSQVDGPDFLHAVVAEVSKKHPIDPNHVYLFGEDTGGVYATALGLYDSQYWSATCVHAAILDPTNYSLFQHAARKEPFEEWVGSQDPDHDINMLTNERDAFTRTGFRFELKVIPNSAGAYGNIYDQVNEGCWKFYNQYGLGGKTSR